MKVNSKILIGLICVIILSGCNDSFLDRIPLDDLTDETYWKTEEHLILAANACINGLRGKGTSVDMEMLGDNVVRERSASYKNIGAGTFTSDLSTINSEWDTNYNGIRRCNHFLENYERAEKVAPEKRERYAGEARFMRAYHYVYLINFFGDVPWVTRTLDISDSELYGAREDKEKLVDWVLKELELSSNQLPYAKDLKTTEFRRPSKEAAWALSSRFALYHERWDIAVSSAELVMETGYHELYSNGNPATSYYEMFTYAGNASKNSKNKEFILTRVFSEDAKQTHNLSRELQVPNEEARMAPSRSLVDAYLCNGLPVTNPASGYNDKTYVTLFDGRDPRLEQTVLKRATKWGGNPQNSTYYQPKLGGTALSGCRTPSGWYFRKFVEISAVARYNKDMNDIPLIRYAEVLLNWIEAKYMRGDQIDQTDINSSINLLRGRVAAPLMILADLESNGMNLRDEIRRERRVELALEGERYFDILRWKQGKLLSEDVKGIRKASLNPDQQVFVDDLPLDEDGNIILMTGRIFVEPKNYLWPVPFIQTQRNPNLLPNNPGWE